MSPLETALFTSMSMLPVRGEEFVEHALAVRQLLLMSARCHDAVSSQSPQWPAIVLTASDIPFDVVDADVRALRRERGLAIPRADSRDAIR